MAEFIEIIRNLLLDSIGAGLMPYHSVDVTAKSADLLESYQNSGH